MKNGWILLSVLSASLLSAQPGSSRRADMSLGGGGGPEGKCTIEVVVDDSAEIDVRGDVANLRTLAGRPAEWRRFQCNAPLPNNPVDFRFSGVDGRGRQELIRDPRQGGSAVVRIVDRDGGAEGYTFDLTWRNGFGGPQYGDRGPGNGPGFGGPPQGGPGFGGPPNGGYVGRRFGSDQDAISACQDEVIQEARDRFHVPPPAIDFRGGSRVEDNGRHITGRFDVRRGRDRDRFRFSCDIDRRAQRIRSVDIDPAR